MIVRLPDLPPMNERGKPLRPLVVLVGSAGIWQQLPARDLNVKAGKAGAVVRTDAAVQGVVQREGYHPEAILAAIRLMVDAADLVVVWVDTGPVWLWLEMGQWIDAVIGAEFIWGIHNEVRGSFHHAGHLLHLLHRVGEPAYQTLEDTITAAGVRLQEKRYDHDTTHPIPSQ